MNFKLYLCLFTFSVYFNPVYAQNNGVSSTLTNESGLKAEYYNLLTPSSYAENTGEDNRELVLTRIDKSINFVWGDGSPHPRVNNDDFIVRWTGYIYAPEDGTYYFKANVDDGVRVWIGNKLIIDEWKRQDVSNYSAKVELYAKKYYSIKVEYYEDWYYSEMRLLWRYNNHPLQAMSSDVFYKNPPKAVVKMAPLPKEKVAIATTEESELTKVGKKEPLVMKNNKEVTPTVTIRKNTSNDTIKKGAPGVEFNNLKINTTLILRNIYFEKSKYILLPKSFLELDRLAVALNEQPKIKIRIAGHTDNVGDPSINIDLSTNRAIAVTNYLISRGISEKRIQYKGFGGSTPIAPNNSEENKSKNRRVELTVLN